MTNKQDPTGSVLERLEKAEQLKIMCEHKEALIILEELLIEDPQNISALEEVADNELSLEHFNRARKAALQAIALDKDSYTGHYILGFLHSRGEEWPEALKELQRANMLKPNNPEILRCLGWALFSGDQRTQGIVTLERALNLDSENPLTLCDLGVTHLQVHNFMKAKALFLRALDLDPTNERAKECVEAVERLEKSAVKK
ncbi:tetratricopeptide repeat protein [Patescibacteria group bacterium]|nr:tetratricopeptide repeat protein [Patescibacteria group bacterium]